MSLLPGEIAVISIEIKPENPAPLDSDLELSVLYNYRGSAPVKRVQWCFAYVVDMTSRRHVIDLGRSEVIDELQNGNHELNFRADETMLENMSQKIARVVMNNTGLLVAKLFCEEDIAKGDTDDEKRLFQISMVTTVEEKDGQLYRNVLNPME